MMDNEEQSLYYTLKGIEDFLLKMKGSGAHVHKANNIAMKARGIVNVVNKRGHFGNRDIQLAKNAVDDYKDFIRKNKIKEAFKVE